MVGCAAMKRDSDVVSQTHSLDRDMTAAIIVTVAIWIGCLLCAWH